MNKFRNSDDGGFKLVSGSLKELVDNASISQHRTEEELQCLRSFITSNYREDKDRNEQRVPKTCMWLLEHQNFLRWSQDLAAGLLWVSADPGCGKSVLSRALVDEGLLKPNASTTAVCYFFFKDDDSSRQNGANALCALLHQLFIQKPALLKYAMLDFQNHGEHLRNMFSTLWDILEKSATDSEAGEIICVLDALDECSEVAREKLIQRMSRFYSSQDKRHTKLKFLVTSRPYSDIERAFHREIEDMTLISLRGEDESETISREIDLVIDERIPRICGARRPPLDPEVQNVLVSDLKKFENRTYLWLHLVLDVIRDTLESTKTHLKRLVSRLPRTVEDAYERILEKVNYAEHAQEARSLLHVVVAAVRPLTLGELRIALAINEKLESGEPCQSREDLDLQSEEAFRMKIRGLCGLFLSIVDSKVYLIHLTAKDFLISKNLKNRSATGDTSTPEVWKHSLAPAESNSVILKICLSLFLLRDLDDECTFLEYAGLNWPAHFQDARIEINDPVMQTTLDVCDPGSYQFQAWWKIHASRDIFYEHDDAERWTSLMVATSMGLETVAKLLLEKRSIELDFQSCLIRKTPLHIAAEHGHLEVVNVLMEKDNIKLNLIDDESQTPLHLAVQRGNLEIVKVLIERDGIGLNLRDYMHKTPLHLAAECGFLEIVKVLIEKDGVELNLKDNRGQTPLHLAARESRSEMIKILVEKEGIGLNLKDNYSRTPLNIAVIYGNLNMVKILVEKDDIKLNLKDEYGRTPLHLAVEYGSVDVAKVLLEKNPELNIKSLAGETAFSNAVKLGETGMVRVLLEKQGLEFDFYEDPGRRRDTLYDWAVRKGYIQSRRRTWRSSPGGSRKKP